MWAVCSLIFKLVMSPTKSLQLEVLAFIPCRSRQYLQNQAYDFDYEDKSLVTAPNLMVLNREHLAHAKRLLDALPPDALAEVYSTQVSVMFRVLRV